MQENLLMNIELRKKNKIWRNLAIFLFFLVSLTFFSSKSNLNKTKKKLPPEYIARIKIDGIIVGDDYRDTKLFEILNNKSIKAVIVEIDSPGGAVVPSEILYEKLSAINKAKPIVVLMQSMATSGGYMTALASDYIVAKNTTLTGSIGVLLQSYEVVKLAEKLGIDFKTYKSTPLKGTPSPTEKTIIEAEIATNEMIGDVYNYFKELVRERRKNITKENFAIATNGQAFTGRQALKLGLIDAIGGEKEVMAYLKTRKVDTNLYIQFIDLKKKKPITIVEKLINRYFFEINYSNKLQESGTSRLMLL